MHEHMKGWGCGVRIISDSFDLGATFGLDFGPCGDIIKITVRVDIALIKCINSYVSGWYSQEDKRMCVFSIETQHRQTGCMAFKMVRFAELSRIAAVELRTD